METLSINTALEMAGAELELRGYTRNEGSAEGIVETWEKEFNGGYVGYIDVYADEHDVWFEISATHGMDIAFCDDEQYPNANVADLYLEDEINKLINAED